MRDFEAPDWTKNLSGSGVFLGRGFIVQKTEQGLEYLADLTIHWVAVTLCGLLVLGTEIVVFNLPNWFGVKGMSIPFWMPPVFYSLATFAIVMTFVFQIISLKNNKPWLTIDLGKREAIQQKFHPRSIPFESIKRVHLASEVVHCHAPGLSDRRHYEVSLLIQDGETAEIEKIALIRTVERSVALNLMDSIKKAIGHRDNEGD